MFVSTGAGSMSTSGYEAIIRAKVAARVAEAEDASVEVDTAPGVVRDRFNVMNAESVPFMRFFEPLVRISSPRRVDPSDRRTDAW